MPRMPFVNEPTQKLQRLNAPAFRNTATVENLSGGEVELAKQLLVPAEKIEKFIIAKQNQIDLTAVQEASAAWKEYEFDRRRFVHNRKGRNAKGSLERETEAYDNFANPLRPAGFEGEPVDEEEGGGATIDGEARGPKELLQRQRIGKLHKKFLNRYEKMDGRQKVAMDEMIRDRRTSYLHAVGMHEDNERVSAMVKAGEDSIKFSIVEAIQAGMNDELRSKAMMEAEATIRANAKALGINDKRDIQIKLSMMRSAVHQGVVETLLNSPTNRQENLLNAKQYVKDRKDITAATRKALGNKLWDHEVTLTSSNLAAKIVMMDGPGQMDAISAIDDPDIRAATETKVFKLSGMARRNKIEVEKQAANTIHDFIQKSKGLSPDGSPLDLNDLNRAGQLYGQAWDVLPFEKKQTLLKINEDMVVGAKQVPEQLDLQTADTVMRMISTDKEKFLDTNFAVDYYGKMTKSRIDSLMNLQRITRESDAKGESSVVSWSQQIDARMEGAKWIGADFAEHRGKTRTTILNMIIAQRTASSPDEDKRKNPTDDQVKKFIDDVITPTYVLNANKKYRVAADPPDASFTNQQQVSAFIKSKGWDAKKKAGKQKIGDFESAVQEAAQRFAATPDKNGVRREPNETDIKNIIQTVGEDVVHRDDGWFNPDNEALWYTANNNPSEWPIDKLYVKTASGEMIYLGKHLGTMNKQEKREAGRWLTERGFKLTHKNIAQVWRMNNPDVVLSKEPVSDGVINNPDGGKTIRVIDLETIIADNKGNREDLLSVRTEIVQKYGKHALGVYDRLLKEADDKYE